MSKQATGNESNGITRRRFVVTGAAAGALAASGLSFGDAGTTEVPPDLAVAHGPDVVKNTEAVIDALGSISRWVKKGHVVNILPNAQGAHPGTSTNPQLVKTVISLCKKAGAKEVRWLTWLTGKYVERSNINALMEGSGAHLVQVDPADETAWNQLEVPKGVTLKQIKVFKALDECDIFISLPIFKDHIGCRFTGVLKNYMGTSHPTDNRKFHPTFEGDDLLHMEQCIADLNTVVRVPDLIIGDAMTILTSKGPFGPGDIAEPQQVVAGTDRVAFDAYGATILGLTGPEVTMIRKAHDHGLGEIDLTKVRLKNLLVAQGD
jgi:uncharacterized protein (DUF362 family)